MFCENCGTKAKEGANFCEECGKPLKKPKKQIKVPKIEINKKTKLIAILTIALIVVVVWLFLTVSNSFKPQAVALDYFKAFSNNDASKLYNYLNVQNKDFTSKKVFKEIMNENENLNIMNYKVTNTNISSDGLEAEVIIKYVASGINSDTMTINLVKDKKNKMIFFDNWKINTDVEVINNYKIKVMKGSKVELASIILDDKYLDEDSGDDEFDVYVIPELFKLEYPVKVSYPVGITTTASINPTSYSNQTTLDFNLDDISKDDQNKIKDSINENLKYIYSSALDGKSYSEIKAKFSKENELEETYNNFKENLNARAKDLDKIEFTNITLNRVDITDEGNLKVSFKMNYDYEIDSKKEDGSSYASVIFSYDDGYKLVDFESFKTYF